MPDTIKILNLGLRFCLELAALGGLAYWGAHSSGSVLGRTVLAVLAPLTAALLWGAFVSPKAAVDGGQVVRAAVEALVFTSATVALVLAGRPGWGAVLAGLALISGVLLRLPGA